jgi:hypothetical protein
MKKRIILAATFLVIVSILLGWIFLRKQRDHVAWIVNQKLVNGDEITIKIDDNFKKIWFSGFPHSGPIIGGGDGRYDVSFLYRGKYFYFITEGDAILINCWNDKVYLISRLWETQDFSFYVFDEGWNEIEAKKFPKQILIPNLFYSLNIPLGVGIDEEARHYPLGNIIENSIMAALWVKAEKNRKYLDLNELEDEMFLNQFKKNYIDPIWDSRMIEANLPVLVRRINEGEN